MPINFPSSPSVNQLFQYNGNSFQWDGSKWRKTNVFSNSIVTEYTSKVEQTTSTVDIQPDKYDYHVLDITGDTTVSIPRATPHSSFILEINYSATVTSYNISGASYDFNKIFSFGSQDTSPRGIFFKPDGTKMYMLGDQNDSIYQYSLSTPWDISTASYDSISISSADFANRFSIFFKPDGTKMYVLNFGSPREVRQYTLSTAWDLSTYSYDNISLSTNLQVTSGYTLFIGDNGYKMYVASQGSIKQYDLGTAWDLSTGSYSGKSGSYYDQDRFGYGLHFKPDGTKVYVAGSEYDAIYQYSLNTPWDISTMSYDTISKSVSAQANPFDLTFKSDGTKMYVLDFDNDRVVQYSSSGPPTATNITWSSNILWAGGSAPTIDYTYSSNILIHFYTTDGINWIASPLSLDSRSS